MTTYREGEEFQHSNLSHLMLARSYLETFLEITPEVGEIEFHDNSAFVNGIKIRMI